MYEYEGEQQKEARSGALQDLDIELERLEKAFSQISAKLGPITNGYNTDSIQRDSVPHPHPQPATELRGRLERLSDLTKRLERLALDVDL